MSFLKFDEFIIESSLSKTEVLILEKTWTKSVKSSHLKNLKYDNKTQILEIEFLNGSVYEYKKVPEKIFRDLAEEQNILKKIGAGIVKGAKKLFGKQVEEGTYGTRFWEMIRRGDYEYKRIK